MENAPEGTTLSFEGGLDMVEDLDKVSYELTLYSITCNTRYEYNSTALYI